MADVVQYKLERMVSEFDDLERRNLFSRPEITEIVNQRRKFEYRLKRPSPLKQDYLTYIDYEKQLDALRLLRKRAIARELRRNGGDKKMKKSVSDFSGVSRIIEIYRLATNKFKGDIQLWFQYLEFCRQRRNGHMKKVLAQVIRFHPKVAGIWIYAAAWEFDNNLNVASARALMQTGLRVCPTSEDLWVEYLRMELTYLNKLMARKVVLGENEGTLVRERGGPEEKQWREENKELFMAIDEVREKYEESDVKNGESLNKLDVFREQGLSILRAVYSGAIRALPSRFSLRTRFLGIVVATELAHSEEMREEILADLKRDFLKEPEYWDWIARVETVGLHSTQEMSTEIMPEKLQKAIQIYEEALKIVPSAVMFNLYIKFLMDAICQQNGESKNSALLGSQTERVDFVTHILMVYEKAERVSCITEDLACQYVKLLLDLRRLDEAKKLADKLCEGKRSDAVHLWVLRLSIAVRCVDEKSSSPSKAELAILFELFRDILMKVSISKAEKLWLMALKYFTNQRRYFDQLVEMSLVLLAKDGGSDIGFSLSSSIVNLVLQRDGIPSARDMYKRFLALPHPGLATYRNCIELELNIASAGDKNCLVKVQKLFESALATYDQEVGLWQDYYNMECKMGTSESAAAVHWRARKILKDNAACLNCRIV